ncbi:hypothetical protein FA15DRAFT_587075 [Coprinopsis marcescibilis]|uniref:Sucraseferredoxin-like protein n=1 Tax=Coprinopsis marcescibilis TaxID=230819 RepID=A0A5C3L388_COPMA|nr:hypothetical protein FA15DRAFT_587075 [Coprinopsis marcescibilis]
MPLRRLASLLFGYNDVDPICSTLTSLDVPVSSADCRSCSDPCDLGHHDPFPKRFQIDWDSEMLGTVKPYHRQIVISTGKSDWERDITDNAGSLAAAMSDSSSTQASGKTRVNGKGTRPVTGLFHTSDSGRISVLNGSHRTICQEDDHETVLVFPDFKMVSEVRRSPLGAQDLWDNAVNPELDRKGGFLEKTSLKTWVLPYSCVILICSHKKRDNRCGIAAPKLEHAFIKSLEAQGWDADTEMEHPSHTMGLALEDLPITPEEREENMTAQLKDSIESKRALIIKVSHVGGHKYAGNCIIYTPTGTGVWYGRVTPHDVDSVVENTIIKGLVLPPLLRGGLNLSRPNCKSLNQVNDW